MSEVFSVLLHNRQRYEQGKEGLWFSLPTTTEKLQAALREIGISADNPQDFFLYDYRSPQARSIKLPRDMVLSADMDELNFLAARLEKLDAAELAELNAALTSPQSDFHNIGQIIDYPENVDFYVHLPDVTGTGQLGDYYLNRSGMVDMPEEWKAGIFLPRFGLHIANTEHGVFTDYGYLVKSGDEWQRVHEGQPVPEEYRVMAYPAPEILRDESKVQPEAAAPAKAPQPVTPILLNGQNSAERMKEITDRLETGIQELFESERYKAYLTTMSKFHSYSFNNTLLIAMQGGQLVAGYNKWRDDFHRNVRKGEKAIKILAPAPFKAKKEVQNYIDRRTGAQANLIMADLVFINYRTGEPAKNSSYDTHLYKLCDEAGIKHFCMHALRHTYATRAIEAGVQPKVLQKILGHASLSTTMDRYVHVTDDSMTGAIAQFEAGTSQISE